VPAQRQYYLVVNGFYFNEPTQKWPLQAAFILRHVAAVAMTYAQKASDIKDVRGINSHTLHKWGKRKTPTCNHWGQQPQTIEHLLHKCPVTQFAGSLTQLHQLQDEEAIEWISRWSKAYEK